MKNMLAYIQVSRPPLTLLGLVASYSLLYFFNKLGTPEGFLLLLSITLGNLGFNIINELKDKDTDTILKPHKPIPSRKVNEQLLWCVAIISLWCSFWCLVLASYYSTFTYLLLGVSGYITATLYNYFRLRDLLGNLALGYTYFIASYLCSYPLGLEFALAFGLLTTAFNLAVQIQDIEGDKLARIITAPIQLGIDTTRVLAVSLALLSSNMFYIAGVTYNMIPSTFVFILANLCVVASVIINKYRLYELLNRVLGRFLILLGFLLLCF